MIRKLPVGSVERIDLTDAYSAGLRSVWIATCVLAVIAATASLFAREYSVNVHHEAEQVLVGVSIGEEDLSGDKV